MKLFLTVNQLSRRVFQVIDVDWCKFMSGRSKGSGAIFKTVIDILRKNSPGIFQRCPYQGIYRALVLLSNKSMLIFPDGIYQFELKAVTDGELVVLVTLYFEIKN